MKRELKNRLTVVIAQLCAIVGFAATPQIKNVKAFQQYPWGKVYITYEVAGDVASSAGSGRNPFLFVTAKDKTTGRMYGDTSSGESFLSGDIGTAAGIHKIVWDVAGQGLAINSANTVFTVMYCDDVYLVVDLSSGSSSSSYPISYLYAVPSGGWSDVYKTTKLVLRRIEAGSFNMGSGSAIYSTTISKPFYCGIFEVTQKQYSLVMGSDPSGDNLPIIASYTMIRGTSNGAEWPSSSAVDSTSFMGKLRTRTGQNFDLPTSAQWEYACRAGTTTAYSYGDTANGDYMWYYYNSSSQAHEVGTKLSNPWGLYDMHGNVWEWCLDWAGSLSGGTDPKGSSSGTERVVRGGSWYEKECTSSWRPSHPPNYLSYGPSSGGNFGFRLVRTLSN